MATVGEPDEHISDESCPHCKTRNIVRKQQYCSECATSCMKRQNDFDDDHDVLFAPSEVGDFQVETDALELCGKHPSFVLEFFCGPCNEFLCHTCTSKHRVCESAVVSIPKTINDLSKDADVQRIITELHETVTKLSSERAGIKRGRYSVRKFKMDAVGKVRAHFEKLATNLKAIEAKVISEVETVCAGIEDEIQLYTEEAEHIGNMSAGSSQTEVFNDLRKDADVKKITAPLQDTFTEMRYGTVGIKRGRNSRRKCKIDAVGKVRAHFKKLATLLKTTEAKAIGELETVCAGIQDEKQISTEKAENLEANFKECLGNMSAESSTTDAQIPLNSKKGKTLMSSADQVLLKKARLCNPGTYHMNERRDEYLGRIATEGCFKPMHSVKNKDTYNVQMAGERMCMILYACLLPDGRVLLSDNMNSKLKSFSPSSNTVTETCSMPSDPRGACCVSTWEIAVALKNKTVHFVSFNPSLKLSRSFKVDHNAWGIAYRDECLFITDWGTKVYIYNLNGSLVQVITVPGVANTYDVALSPGGELLYVTSNIGLVCLERCGRSVFTRGVRPYCTGVCVNESGSVVVCDNESNRVVQVGEDGEVLVALLGSSDGVRSPWSVCVDGSNMKLYVTMHYNNELLVADIEVK